VPVIFITRGDGGGFSGEVIDKSRTVAGQACRVPQKETPSHRNMCESY